jgi:hypothetical protein
VIGVERMRSSLKEGVPPVEWHSPAVGRAQRAELRKRSSSPRAGPVQLAERAEAHPTTRANLPPSSGQSFIHP